MGFLISPASRLLGEDCGQAGHPAPSAICLERGWRSCGHTAQKEASRPQEEAFSGAGLGRVHQGVHEASVCPSVLSTGQGCSEAFRGASIVPEDHLSEGGPHWLKGQIVQIAVTIRLPLLTSLHMQIAHTLMHSLPFHKHLLSACCMPHTQC